MIMAGVSQTVERGVLVCSARRDERQALNRLAPTPVVARRSAGGGRGASPAPAPHDDEFAVDWALAVRHPHVEECA